MLDLVMMLSGETVTLLHHHSMSSNSSICDCRSH